MTITGDLKATGKWEENGSGAVCIKIPNAVLRGGTDGKKAAGLRFSEDKSQPPVDWSVSFDPNSLTDAEAKLVGKWKLVRKSDGYVFELELRADKTGVYNSYDPGFPEKKNFPLLWKIGRDRLVVKSPPGQPEYVSQSYKIEGGKLIDDLGVAKGEAFNKQ
jgi:hypothetical protein